MRSLQARRTASLAAVCSWLPALLCFACGPRPDIAAHMVVPPSAGAASSYSVPGAALRQPSDECPMSIEGADVLFVPLEYGGALVFTSSLASPAVLRRAVQRFVQACQSGAANPAPHGIPTSVRYADTVAGARVEIRALAAHQISQLERHLRWLAFDMREHRSCNAAAARRSALNELTR